MGHSSAAFTTGNADNGNIQTNRKSCWSSLATAKCTLEWKHVLQEEDWRATAEVKVKHEFAAQDLVVKGIVHYRDHSLVLRYVACFVVGAIITQCCITLLIKGKWLCVFLCRSRVCGHEAKQCGRMALHHLSITLMCHICLHNDKLWGAKLLPSIPQTYRGAAGCSAISPRATHKSLCWARPPWPFISAVKPSCCPPVLTHKKTAWHQLSGPNRSSRRPRMDVICRTVKYNRVSHNPEMSQHFVSFLSVSVSIHWVPGWMPEVSWIY